MKNEATVIIDGIFGRHRRWETLRRKVEGAVGPASIWEYPNDGRVGLDVLGGWLGKYLISLKTPFHLIGYSMGGLIVREAMRQNPELCLRRAAFMNVPHFGSILAHCLPLPALRQMRLKSKFLAALNAAHWPYPTLTTWCPGDLVVLPAKSARWPLGDRIYRCDVPAHVWPVFSPGIHRRILEFLSERD